MWIYVLLISDDKDAVKDSNEVKFIIQIIINNV